MATVTATKTLAVNPAFLQEIKDSNPDLWETVHRLRQLCESRDCSMATVKALAKLLDDMRDELSLQFALEEAYGFQRVPCVYDDASVEGRQSLLANRACDQHCELYLRLSDLAERAEELQFRGGSLEGLRSLVASSEAFDAKLREHERLEANLIDGLIDPPTETSLC